MNEDEKQNAHTQALLDELRSLKHTVVFSAGLISASVCAVRIGGDPNAILFGVSSIVLLTVLIVIGIARFKR